MLENDNFKTQSTTPGYVLCAKSVVFFYYNNFLAMFYVHARSVVRFCKDKFVALLFDVKFKLRSFTE